MENKTSKHTPGPWIVGGNDISPVIDIGLSVCAISPVDIWGIKVWYYGEQTVANAHLIAAAPDLLEALEEFVNWLELGDHEGEMHAKAVAAIAKAKGEQV